MSLGNETLDYYARNADSFVSGTISADMAETRSRFTAHLPASALILDFGCGSGRDTKAFLDAGFRVEATDGSEALCAKAAAYTGIPVRKALFSDLDARDRYDGIWACASILHLPKDELAQVLGKIEAALKTGGTLYTSFKCGSFEGLKDGRYFTCFTPQSLEEFWRRASSLRIFDRWITRDVRPGRDE